MIREKKSGKEIPDVFTVEITSVNNILFMMGTVDRKMEWLVRVAKC